MAEKPKFHGKIENPSYDFRLFRRQFFSDYWTAIKGEYNREALRRLTGAERELAEQLIEENLAVGPQFANAAADLGLVRLAPKLREMFEGEPDNVDLGCALRRMGAISSDRVREAWMARADQDEKWLQFPLPFCCEVLEAYDAALIVRRAVGSTDFIVRLSGSMVLIGLEELIANGGYYADSMTAASNARWQRVFRSDDAAAQWRANAGGSEGDPVRIAEMVARADRAVEAAARLPRSSSEPPGDPH